MPTAKKPRRRNTEKRKEKSRDAARSRRGKEAEFFSDMSAQLPVAAQAIEQIDKTSIMRLAISHLKLRTLFHTESRDHVVKEEHDVQYLKALDGFVMLLDSEGEMLYVSDNVNKHLGLTMLDLTGQSVYEFTHPCDHDEIRDTLTGPEDDDKEHVFFMRLKCTLTTKGRNVNLKSASYKVIRCSGYNQRVGTSKLNLQLSTTGGPIRVMAIVGRAVPHPSNIETPLDCKTFLSRHSMSMKFTYVDDRIEELLGYKASELIDKSVYDYHHAVDTTTLQKAYNTLFSKGQTETCMYRFLAKHGGYVWVQTQATIIYNNKTEKPENVVCVNYIISGLEEANTVFSTAQMNALSVFTDGTEEAEEDGHTFILSTESIFDNENHPLGLSSTELDLNEALAEFSSRAPSAGDVMVPLEINTDDEIINEKLDFLGELCEGTQQDLPFMLSLHRDNTPSPLTISSSHSPNSSVNIDAIGSPDMLVSSTSSGAGMHHIESTDSLTIPESLIDEMEDIALELRAPYIPMNDDEDLVFASCAIPLLDEDNLVNNMLGTTESVFAPDPDEQKKTKQQEPIPMSILKQLAQDNAIRLPGKDVARNAGPPKMKRPMETNRLETGPPVAKRQCMDRDVQQQHSPDVTSVITTVTDASPTPQQVSPQTVIPVTTEQQQQQNSAKASVLMNLLRSGHDDKYGYNVQQQLMEQQVKQQTIPAKQMLPVKQIPTTVQPEAALQQPIVSSTTPSKATSLVSLLRPATIEQLIQARLSAGGQGNIPIRLVLPQGTVIQHNSQLAHLLHAVATTEQQQQSGGARSAPNSNVVANLSVQ